MKPLFDSETFSFIGGEDNQIYVHCRKCGNPADVEVIADGRRAPGLIAVCGGCSVRGSFTFVNAKWVARPAVSGQ